MKIGDRPPLLNALSRSLGLAPCLGRLSLLLSLSPVWFGRVPVCVESKRFECKIIIKQWGSLKAGAVGVGGGRAGRRQRGGVDSALTQLTSN